LGSPSRTSFEHGIDGIDGIDLVLDSCHWHASGRQPLDNYLLPGQLTITQSAAPLGSEVLLSIVTLAVVVLVPPSLALLVYLDQRGELESPQA